MLNTWASVYSRVSNFPRRLVVEPPIQPAFGYTKESRVLRQSVTTHVVVGVFTTSTLLNFHSQRASNLSLWIYSTFPSWFYPIRWLKRAWSRLSLRKSLLC